MWSGLKDRYYSPEEREWSRAWDDVEPETRAKVNRALRRAEVLPEAREADILVKQSRVRQAAVRATLPPLLAYTLIAAASLAAALVSGGTPLIAITGMAMFLGTVALFQRPYIQRKLRRAESVNRDAASRG
jgi:hypothetical protein